MANLLYTFTLFTTFWKVEGDFLDCFWPFAVLAIPGHGSVNIINIHGTLNNRLKIKIPGNVIIQILDRAEKNGYIEKEDDIYRLTYSGTTYKMQQEMAIEKNIKTKIDLLLTKLESYFKENGIHVENREDLQNVIMQFIDRNVCSLIKILHLNIEDYDKEYCDMDYYDRNDYTEQERALIQFIIGIKEDEQEYKIIRDIILGSLIYVILCSRKDDNSLELRKEKYRSIKIYLDTNFIFSIFEMHSPNFNKFAKELLDLLKEFGFDIRVFNFTIAEMKKWLESYVSKGASQAPDKEIQDLYSILLGKKWGNADNIEFNAELISKFTKLGITIDHTPQIDLEHFKPNNEQYWTNLKEFYKPKQSDFVINHDIAAIEKIKEIRENEADSLENAKAIFLTSDKKLSRFNFKDMGHERHNTFPEVISDILLTNILWLANPKLSLPIDSIVEASSHDILNNWSIWEKFLELSEEAKKSGRMFVDPSEFQDLLFFGYINKVIEKQEEENIETISSQQMVDTYKKAKKIKEEETIDTSIERVLSKRREDRLRRIEKVAENKSGFIITSIKVILGASILFILTYYLIGNNWESLKQVQLIIYMILTAIILINQDIWTWSKKKLFEYYKNKMIDIYMIESG